jgi:hypothetical protein
VRIGEALGLRHEDMGVAERQVTVVPRDNDNRARAKAGRSRVILASPELMRLYADYLNREYGALDSDYVFVNLLGRAGRPSVGLPGGLRPGAAVARAHRHRLRAPPRPSHLRDLAASPGRWHGVDEALRMGCLFVNATDTAYRLTLTSRSLWIRLRRPSRSVGTTLMYAWPAWSSRSTIA